MKSILITQCLQNDFVQPIGKYEDLPNLLHVGYQEATRLMGLIPAEGPVTTFMTWACQQKDSDLEIIHIRDWHDANDPLQKDHLQTFGNHCIQDTPGASFCFSVSSQRKSTIVNSKGLNDFIDTDLEKVLSSYAGQKVRVGIIGVWTEAKVSYLAYDIHTRFPEFEIAVCSALTASSSVHSHYAALDQLKKILRVRLFNSPGEFSGFLSYGKNNLSVLLNVQEDFPELVFSKEIEIHEDDRRVIKYLFRGSRKVNLKPLNGGFSGNLVLGCESIDLEGRTEVPHILKIGSQEPIGKERMSFEKVEQVLGNNAPRIVDFVDYNGRGGIKYRYASMGKGQSMSFQKKLCTGADLTSIHNYLDTVFSEQLGRFYIASTLEKTNLLEYYCFSPAWSDNVKKRVDAIMERSADEEQLKLPHTPVFRNPWYFYTTDLTEILPKAEGAAYFAYVHGDLNGANIMIDSQDNVWLIDFFHTHRGHILKDLIKLENDLLYIFTQINNEKDWEQAMMLSECLFEVEDLAYPIRPVEQSGITDPMFIRTYKTIQMLRSYYHELIKLDRNPLQLFIAQLRYAVHTLSFDECTSQQKQWALYNSGKFAEIVSKRIKETGRLRVDWIESEAIPSDKIGLTILPGRKDYSRDLQEDLKELKKLNVTTIIPLITEDEMNHYGVEDLLDVYEKEGFKVKPLSIKDQMVCTEGEMKELCLFLEKEIAGRNKVVIHCVGGLGRSGMVAASYLKFKGIDASLAIEQVRQSRSPRAIESKQQEDFVKEVSFK